MSTYITRTCDLLLLVPHYNNVAIHFPAKSPILGTQQPRIIFFGVIYISPTIDENEDFFRSDCPLSRWCRLRRSSS